MRRLRASVGILLLVPCALLTSCSKDSNPVAPAPPAAGSIFVQVLGPDRSPIGGAMVLLNPTARADTTDMLGTAWLEELTPGDYVVLASRAGVGSGKSVVTVKSGEVTQATLVLVPGIYPEPAVAIQQPGRVSEFSYVDTVRFVASVADLEDRASSLQLQWRSDRDGALPSAPARADGIAQLATDALTLGEHWVTLRATDSHGRVGADSVRVAILSYPPQTWITAPIGPAQFTPGEPITVTAHVADRETPVAQLVMHWDGSVDGDLGAGSVDAEGSASVTRSDLAFGDQWIRIRVSDTDGHETRDSVMIHNVLPGAIALEPPVVSGGRVSLRWTRAIAAGFDRYEVYRATSPGTPRSGAPARVLSSLTDTTWVDSLPPFATQVYYRVYVINTAGYSRGSEERAVPSPGGLVLTGVSFDDAVMHPSQPWIYLHERATGRITVVDYRAMAVVRTLTLGLWTGFMDLVDSGYGLELLLPRQDGWVEVRDPVDLHVVTSINTGLSNASAVGDGRGTIYVSMSPSPWWERPLRSYRRSDGSYIDGNGDFDTCRLRMLPGESQIIEITMSVSPVDMDYYLMSPDGHIVRHVDDTQHGGTPLDPYLYRVSPAQGYLVTSSSGAVYSADSSMVYLGQLPHGTLTFGDFAFSADGTAIYGGCSNERLVKIHAFPGLGETGYLPTRGYPKFVWRVGDELISVSRTTAGSYYDYGPFDVGIEVLPIPSAVPGPYPYSRIRRVAGAAVRPMAGMRVATPGH